MPGWKTVISRLAWGSVHGTFWSMPTMFPVMQSPTLTSGTMHSVNPSLRRVPPSETELYSSGQVSVELLSSFATTKSDSLLPQGTA